MTTRDATFPDSSRSKTWLIADKWLQFDVRLDLALGGEGQRFGHVFARADE